MVSPMTLHIGQPCHMRCTLQALDGPSPAQALGRPKAVGSARSRSAWPRGRSRYGAPDARLHTLSARTLLCGCGMKCRILSHCIPPHHKHCHQMRSKCCLEFTAELQSSNVSWAV